MDPSSIGTRTNRRRGNRNDSSATTGSARAAVSANGIMSSKATTLTLYRSLLRASGGFTNYNFRDYALRSVRERFRANVALSEPEAVSAAVHEARYQLDLVKRQTVVSQLFPQGKHAMEGPPVEK